jgi:predicted outer membrane repeat protein
VQASGGSTVRLDGLWITGGNADGAAEADQQGAGIHSTAPLKLVRCRITRNMAGRGAGVFTAAVTLPASSFVNCAFAENVATGAGGALYSETLIVNLANCLFSGNTAVEPGGAVRVEQGRMDLHLCTFYANASDAPAGGGAFAGPRVMRLFNCIAWGNRAAGAEDQAAQLAGGNLTVEHCCVQGWDDSLGGPGNHGKPPLFVDPLGPDGLPGTLDDDLRLGPQSPCVDAGDNARLPNDVVDLDGDGNQAEPLPLDLDMRRRRADDPTAPDTGAGQPPVVDMGAYER